MKTINKIILAGLSVLVVGCSQAKIENMPSGSMFATGKMPELPNVPDRCKRFSNFGNPAGKRLGTLVEFDLYCGKITGAVYKKSSVSAGYLICNEEIIAEEKPFGIFIKNRLHIDKNRDGFVDYVIDLEMGSRKVYEDAPACQK